MSVQPLQPPAFGHTLTAETLAERHQQYKAAERNARRSLATAQEALELAEAQVLQAIPGDEYTTKASDTRGRRAEQLVILSTKDEVVKARARVAGLEDALREAEDFCSDLAYYQRERQNQAADLFFKGSMLFSKAVEVYASLRAGPRPIKEAA